MGILSGKWKSASLGLQPMDPGLNQVFSNFPDDSHHLGLLLNSNPTPAHEESHHCPSGGFDSMGLKKIFFFLAMLTLLRTVIISEGGI